MFNKKVNFSTEFQYWAAYDLKTTIYDLLFFTVLYFPKNGNKQLHSNWFVYKEAPAYKRVVRRSAHPQYE